MSNVRPFKGMKARDRDELLKDLVDSELAMVEVIAGKDVWNRKTEKVVYYAVKQGREVQKYGGT